MRLHHINIILDENIENENYRSLFEYHARYVCHYLTQRIRKATTAVSLDYNLLCIKVGSEVEPHIEMPEVLIVGVPFEKDTYECNQGSPNGAYYIGLVRRAMLRIDSKLTFPRVEMENIINEFEAANYVNTWRFKNKRFREVGIRAECTCRFTTNLFALHTLFYDLKTHQLLCEGDAIVTKPDEVYFSQTFKDVIVKNEKIVVTDYNGYELLAFKLSDIRQGHFIRMFGKCPWKNSDTAKDNWDSMIKEMKYRS